MDPELLVALVGLVAAIVTAVRPWVGSVDHRRRRIHNDLDLLEKVPQGMSETRERLETVIARDVARLVESDLEERREPLTAVSAAVGSVALGALAVWLVRTGGWWLVAAVVPALVSLACAYGFYVATRKVRRDAGGRPVLDL